MAPRLPQPTTPVLAVEIEPARERVIVRLAGEIDLANAPGLQGSVVELLERGFASVQLDLRAVSFIDSSGIHALLACRQRAQQLNARLTVDLVPGQVWRTLELVGVLEHLLQEPSPDPSDAIAAPGKRRTGPPTATAADRAASRGPRLG